MSGVGGYVRGRRVCPGYEGMSGVRGYVRGRRVCPGYEGMSGYEGVSGVPGYAGVRGYVRGKKNMSGVRKYVSLVREVCLGKKNTRLYPRCKSILEYVRSTMVCHGTRGMSIRWYAKPVDCRISFKRYRSVITQRFLS